VAWEIEEMHFKAGYMNEEEFLTRPDLGDIDYIELPWKEEMLDQKVFDLSCRTRPSQILIRKR
jgi:hypothetical protein